MRTTITIAHHADVPAGLDWLGPAERRFVAGLRFEKRRADWLLGRYVAKRALAAWSPAFVGAEILRGADGGPVVQLASATPCPVSISLSHRAGYGACALALPGAPVGVDLERIEPRTDRMLADFFTEAERRAVGRALDPALTANLIWSAKESVLKALRTGLRRDTRTVQVTVEDGAFTAADTLAERTYRGWWARHGDMLVTAVGPPPPCEVQWPAR